MLRNLVWITKRKNQLALGDLGRQEVYFTLVGSEEIAPQRSEPEEQTWGTICSLTSALVVIWHTWQAEQEEPRRGVFGQGLEFPYQSCQPSYT